MGKIKVGFSITVSLFLVSFLMMLFAVFSPYEFLTLWLFTMSFLFASLGIFGIFAIAVAFFDGGD